MPYRGGVSVVQQLWILDLARGRAGQLLLSNASDIHPRWSPDGSRLAFSSNRTGRYEIWTVAADGSGARQVTDGPGEKTWPTWSPDGKRILFTHTQSGRSGVSLVSIEGGEITPYQPFGAGAAIQIKDADWRAASD
jgi:Tol biopolymer transport system component